VFAGYTSSTDSEGRRRELAQEFIGYLKVWNSILVVIKAALKSLAFLQLCRYIVAYVCCRLDSV